MTSMNFGGRGLLALLGLGLAAGPDARAAAPAAGPYLPAAEPKPPLTGKLLYARNCARCHGLNGKAGISGAHDLTRSNLNAFGRTYLVTKGMGKMPSFQQQLTAKEIEAVVAYSLTLK